MFSQNFKKSFTGNWNWKMEPSNDMFGRVSGAALFGLVICKLYGRKATSWKSATGFREMSLYTVIRVDFHQGSRLDGNLSLFPHTNFL